MEFGDDEEEDETDKSNKHKLILYLLANIWADGWAVIGDMNIWTVREHMQERREHVSLNKAPFG